MYENILRWTKVYEKKNIENLQKRLDSKSFENLDQTIQDRNDKIERCLTFFLKKKNSLTMNVKILTTIKHFVNHVMDKNKHHNIREK